jgi:hypothetical protein
MRSVAAVLVILTALVLLPAGLQSLDQELETPLRIGGVNDPQPPKQLAAARICHAPLAFTENQGQWDDSILFRADAGGATMWFTKGGAYFQFMRYFPRDEQATETGPHVRLGRLPEERGGVECLMLKTSFVAANPNPRVVGEDKLQYRCNFFLGNDPAAWRTDVPNYRAVRFEEVYPGIELRYYGKNRQMEYDFIVSPRADYSQIQVQYEGAKSLSVNDVGQLIRQVVRL